MMRAELLGHLRNTLARPTSWLLAGRGVQLLNSVLLSAIIVRRFGLGMVGTFAIGYIAVAFLPHIVSLGLNSELPRLRRSMPELLYIAAVVQAVMACLLVPVLYGYAAMMARSTAERPIIFIVALFGSFTGMFNVALTLKILQKRYRGALFSPLIELLLLVMGARFARSGLDMAGFALAGKALTFVLMWPWDRMQRVPSHVVLAAGRQGSKYLSLDMISTASEQLIPLVLGVSVPRAQLGVFRLCQQISSAAETPGWSFVQAKYPELTEGNHARNADIARKGTRLGLLAAGLCVVGSVPMAYGAFHTPVVAKMMLVLSLGLVGRYACYVNDWRLRAAGRVGPTLVLAVARVIFCGVLLECTVRAFGVWAGIWTSALASMLFGWWYQRVADRTEQGPARGLAGSTAALDC